MRFFRGVACFLIFVLCTVGFCLFVVSRLVGTKELMGIGIAFFAVGVGISVITSLIYSKGKRFRVMAYLYLNGSLIFGNMLIIGIPFVRMTINNLTAMNSPFIVWKYSNKIETQAKNACGVPKVRKCELNNMVENYSVESLQKMTTEKLIDICKNAREDFDKRLVYALQDNDDITREDYEDMKDISLCTVASVISLDKNTTKEEIELFRSFFSESKKSTEVCKKMISDKSGNIDDLISFANTIESFEDNKLSTSFYMLIKCAMVVDGPIDKYEQEFLDVFYI